MFVIGTAGHIDHGKTTLVQTLTGIETDRLKEERERGISIELGFAYTDIAGIRCGIIDVPGHERFVRQMIAGASGIDLVVLVVAADEGVMQQTREHLDICKLLGVRRGVVVLTKCDLVDEEWLELVESDLEDFVEGSFLQGAPVQHFSAPDTTTHEPLERFIGDAIRSMKAERHARAVDQPLRLPVDRVFTMKGFGTVITGTICSGRLAEGDAIAVLPEGPKCKVRGLQSHGDSAREVVTGQRAAVNLAGVEKELLHRGDVVTRAGTLMPSRMLDVDLTLLSHVPKAVESQAKALVHVGTSQVTGTIVLLDRESLEPGDTAPAQIRLDRFVVALGGDHVVIRGFELLESYGKTLGGGPIRHPLPRRHKRDEAPVLAALDALGRDDLEEAVEQVVSLTGHVGATPAEIRQVVNASVSNVGDAIGALAGRKVLFRYVESGVPRLIHTEPFGQLLTKATRTLASYHERYPHRAGIPREELRSQIRSDLPQRYFAAVIEELVASEEVALAGTRLRRPDFAQSLSAELEQLRERIYRRIDEAGLEPPFPDEIRVEQSEAGAQAADTDEMIEMLIAQERVHRVAEKLLFAAGHIRRLDEQVVGYLEKHGEMTTPQLKEITKTTRKYTVPLGEHLDARKVTIRAGDVRKLR